jgi:sec-independent protein translocase protein TatC
MWSVLVLCAGCAIGYMLRHEILAWLQAPLHASLYYNKVTGAFEFLMQACLLVGVLCCIPVAVYNLVGFVRPALPRPVSRWQILRLVGASCVLTVGGVLFAYYLSLPTVVHFLSNIDIANLHPLIAADSYLTFVMTYLAVFALIFQLPLIMTFIDRFTPLPPQRLKAWRKWVIIGAVGAGLILPIAPDPLSQLMLALPIIVLYEVTIWLIVAAHWRRRPRRLPAPTTEPRPVPALEPRAVAVPQTAPRPRRVVRMDAVGSRGGVIDLRQHKA